MTEHPLGFPDQDGQNDFLEMLLGTSPLDMDSDGDGVSDADEIATGSDPSVNNPQAPSCNIQPAN